MLKRGFCLFLISFIAFVPVANAFLLPVFPLAARALVSGASAIAPAIFTAAKTLIIPLPSKNLILNSGALVGGAVIANEANTFFGTLGQSSTDVFRCTSFQGVNASFDSVDGAKASVDAWAFTNHGATVGAGWAYSGSTSGGNPVLGMSERWTKTFWNSYTRQVHVTCLAAGQVVTPAIDGLQADYDAAPDKQAWTDSLMNSLRAFALTNPDSVDTFATVNQPVSTGMGEFVNRTDGLPHSAIVGDNGITIDGTPATIAAPLDNLGADYWTWLDQYQNEYFFAADSSGRLTVLDHIDATDGIPLSPVGANDPVPVGTVINNSSTSIDQSGATTKVVSATDAYGTQIDTTTVTDAQGNITSQTTKTSAETEATQQANADAQAATLGAAMAAPLAAFSGDGSGTRPMMEFHIDGDLAHTTDMSNEFASLGASSMLAAIMGTMGMIVSLLLVSRAVMS